jgi:DNA-binding transcriptional LysR family regulator
LEYSDSYKGYIIQWENVAVFNFPGGLIMDYDQIKYFLAIANFGGFSKAAEEVFVSQSSLSKQIKALENELGTELFIRGHSTVELTEPGKDFLDFAEKANYLYDELLTNISKYSFGKFSSIRIGSIPIISTHGLANLFAKFQSCNEKINIALYEKEQHAIMYMLNSNQIDVAIVRTDQLAMDKYDALSCCRDELVIVCRDKNPVSKKATARLQDLQYEKIVLLDSKSSLYHLCISEFTKCGLSPKIILTTTRHQVLLEMISEDLGISLLPRKLVDLKNYPQLRIVELQDMIYSNISLIKTKEAKITTTVKRFWDFVGKNLSPSS